MSNKIKLLGLIIVFSACGHKRRVNIDDRARPYVDEFIRVSEYVDRKLKIEDLIVVFGDTRDSKNPKRVGYCETGGNSTPRIVLDLETWNRFEAARRIALMFHELGHCVLNREHVLNTEDESFMEPYIISGIIIVEDYPELTQELFRSDKLGPEFSFGDEDDSLNFIDLDVSEDSLYEI